jgi:3-oxoacyl-[acyl-carrier protein] reductase
MPEGGVGLMDLEGRCAVVTGGGRGIGRAVCLALSRKGADVAAVDVLEAEAGATSKEIEALGRKAAGIVCDVTSPADVQAMFKGVISALGGVHILVNNAGITRDNLIMRMSDEDWRKVIDVNLSGVFNCCREASRYFMKQRFGRIVNISSVVGLMGNAGQVNYSASKAGIVGLTKSVAKELASRGVTANAVAPGYIDTEMTRAISGEARARLTGLIPLSRLGTVDDVANVVAFLVSEEAGYITGQVIQVDGGMLM